MWNNLCLHLVSCGEMWRQQVVENIIAVHRALSLVHIWWMCSTKIIYTESREYISARAHAKLRRAGSAR